jgi:hypothetical protein
MGQRLLSGLWWPTTTGGHVESGSWLERGLLALDFDPGGDGDRLAAVLAALWWLVAAVV